MSLIDHAYQFEGASGVPFTARLVQAGDGYGQWNKNSSAWALKKDSEKPVIEFYDRRYSHTPHGQFISRYLVETLQAKDERASGRGLCLDTGAAQWVLTEGEVDAAVASLLPFVRRVSRGDLARLQAEQITEGFEYQRVGEATGSGTVEVWRCARPGDFDHAHDLVITRMGICAFGDMDPLVFRVGADHGLKFLAGKDVDYYIHSKLDESSKKWELDEDEVYRRVSADVLNHLEAIWGAGSQDALLAGGPVKDAVDVMRAVQSGGHKFALSALLGVLQAAASVEPERLPAAGRWSRIPAVRDRLRSLLLDLSEVRTVNDLHHCLSLADSEFNGVFDDFDPEGLTRPAESVLVRLHILNIGAKRMLEIQAQQEAASAPVERQRG